MKINKKYFAIIIFILLLIALDQISKFYALKKNEAEIIPSFIKIENVNNEEIEKDKSIVMNCITNLVIIGVIVRFMVLQTKKLTKSQYAFLSLIIAGGLSNLIDTLLRGYVIYFIKIGQKLPNINLASIYIIVGWVMIVAYFTKYSYNELKERKKNANKDK